MKKIVVVCMLVAVILLSVAPAVQALTFDSCDRAALYFWENRGMNTACEMEIENWLWLEANF
ncbi:MAG: hypothetical protein V1838_03090 [Patescibacteria group bacterium]